MQIYIKKTVFVLNWLTKKNVINDAIISATIFAAAMAMLKCCFLLVYVSPL